MSKPEIKYEEGKIVAKVNQGLDADKDGKNSIEAELLVKIDAIEAVSEIIKNEVPQWLLDLIAKKQE